MFPVFAICLILRLPNITVLLPYVLNYGILLYNGYLEQQYKHLCKGSNYNTDLFKLFRYFDINSEYFQSTFIIIITI